MPKTFHIPADFILPLLDDFRGALATDRVVVDGAGVGYCYREAPAHPLDSGWRFFNGDETDAYLADLSNTGIYSLNTIANYEVAVLGILEAPEGSAFDMGPTGEFVAAPAL